MKVKKLTINVNFKHDKGAPFSIRITRLNPSIQQIEEIRDYINISIQEEIDLLRAGK